MISVKAYNTDLPYSNYVHVWTSALEMQMSMANAWLDLARRFNPLMPAVDIRTVSRGYTPPLRTVMKDVTPTPTAEVVEVKPLSKPAVKKRVVEAEIVKVKPTPAAAPAAKVEAPKPAAKVETPKPVEAKVEVKVETPKPVEAKIEAPKPAAKVEAPKPVEAKVEAPKPVETKVEAPKVDAPKPAPAVEATAPKKPAAAKADTSRTTSRRRKQPTRPAQPFSEK